MVVEGMSETKRTKDRGLSNHMRRIIIREERRENEDNKERRRGKMQ